MYAEHLNKKYIDLSLFINELYKIKDELEKLIIELEKCLKENNLLNGRLFKWREANLQNSPLPPSEFYIIKK